MTWKSTFNKASCNIAVIIPPKLFSSGWDADRNGLNKYFILEEVSSFSLVFSFYGTIFVRFVNVAPRDPSADMRSPRINSDGIEYIRRRWTSEPRERKSSENQRKKSCRQEWSIDRCISSRDSELTCTEKQRFSVADPATISESVLPWRRFSKKFYLRKMKNCC